MGPHEVVLQFAAESFDLFLSFEMGKKLIEQKESRLSTGHRTPDAGQIMQLPKGASEGRLAALVWAADDDDPLFAAQDEIIADDRALGIDELLRQRQIKAVAIVHPLRHVGDVRVAELQSGMLEVLSVLQIRDIEMNFAIESCYRFVDEVSMPSAI